MIQIILDSWLAILAGILSIAAIMYTAEVVSR